MDPAALRDRVETIIQLWTKATIGPGQSGRYASSWCASTRGWRPQATRPPRSAGRRGREPATGGSAGRSPRSPRCSRTTTSPVGVMTALQLQATAAAHSDLGDAELEGASAKAKLRVVEPGGAPAEAGMSGRFASLVKALATAGAATVPALVFPGSPPSACLVASPSQPRRGLALSQRLAEKRAVLALDQDAGAASRRPSAGPEGGGRASWSTRQRAALISPELALSTCSSRCGRSTGR